MFKWHAKVHKSGNKVAIFNGEELIKVVESSKQTFEPAEAQKFAEELVKELGTRSAAQMTTPNQPPSVSTESELHADTLHAVTEQATGKGAGDKPITPPPAVVLPEVDAEANKESSKENENLRNAIATLKKRLSKEQNERTIERKARRGLAIAKQLVVEGKLEDSYDSIKSKVAEIVHLEDAEIDRLERKTAGDHEFESIEDAQKEIRRQSRISRINRQAAAEAQEDNDESQAESLDQKADEAEKKVSYLQLVVEQMKKSEKDEKKETTETEVPPVVPAEPPKEEKKEKEPPKEEKKEKEAAAPVKTESVPPTMQTPPTTNTVEEKSDPKVEEPPKTCTEEQCKSSSDLASLARNYRTIAANHRKLAEKAETEGDIQLADDQDALADDAESKAEKIEEKLSAKPKETPEQEETETAEHEQTETPAEETEEHKESSTQKTQHQPLKRINDDGKTAETIESSFGIDKNASLVEQNDFTGDPDVEILSKMWRGAPKD